MFDVYTPKKTHIYTQEKDIHVHMLSRYQAEMWVTIGPTSTFYLIVILASVQPTLCGYWEFWMVGSMLNQHCTDIGSYGSWAPP